MNDLIEFSVGGTKFKSPNKVLGKKPESILSILGKSAIDEYGTTILLSNFNEY